MSDGGISDAIDRRKQMDCGDKPPQSPQKKRRIHVPSSLRAALKQFDVAEIAAIFQVPIRVLPAHLFKQQTPHGRRTRSQGQTSKRTAGTRHPENTIETTNTNTNPSNHRPYSREDLRAYVNANLPTLAALASVPCKPIVKAGLPVTGRGSPGLSTRLSSGQRRGRAVRRLRTGTLPRPRRLT